MTAVIFLNVLSLNHNFLVRYKSRIWFKTRYLGSHTFFWFLGKILLYVICQRRATHSVSTQNKNCIAIFVNGTSGKPSPTESFVFLYNYSLIGKVWLPLLTRHTPCPYGYNTNVSCIAVGDGFLHVPKRHLYINLKFGQPFYPNNPTFPLNLPAVAHRRFARRGTRQIMV